jgi:hypothetical protein
MQSVCPGRRAPATKAGPLPRFLFVSGARRVVCVRCSLVRRFAHGFQSAGFARVLAVGPRPPRNSFASLTSPAPCPSAPRGGSLRARVLVVLAGVGGSSAPGAPFGRAGRKGLAPVLLLKKVATHGKPKRMLHAAVLHGLFHSLAPDFVEQLNAGQPGFEPAQNWSTNHLWASPHAGASRGHPDALMVIKRCFVDQ